MREIKYRAWLIAGKRFVQIESLRFDHKGNVTDVCYLVECGVGPIKGSTSDKMYSYTRTQKVGLDKVVLTQYTGLKDKNGKEIYEDDIVKHQNGCVLAIEWLKGMAGWYLMQNSPNRYEGFQFHEQDPINQKTGGIAHVEVIGNIRENPELLSK